MAASTRYPSASRSFPSGADTSTRRKRRASSLIILGLLALSVGDTQAGAATIRDAGKAAVRERSAKVKVKVVAAKPEAVKVRVVAAKPEMAKAPAKAETPSAVKSALSVLSDDLVRRGLTTRSVTLAGLLDDALGNGRDIQAARKSAEIAAAGMESADAAFDPVFTASLNHTRVASFKRGETITRWRDQDSNAKDDTSTNDDDPSKSDGSVCKVVVDGEAFYNNTDANCFKPPIYSSDYEYASGGATGGGKPSRIYSGSIGLSWNAPFGLSSSLSISAKHNHKYGFQTPALTGVYSSYDPFGWGDERFWTSSAVLSLSMPLPYTKGFGWDGSASMLAFRAAETSERAARAAEESARNAALGDTASAYWDLVLAAERLKAVAEQRALLKERGERVRRLIGEGRASDYDADQVRSALIALDRSEEEYRTGYLVTANRLATLTGGDRAKVVVPTDADALLAAPPALTADAIFRAPPDGHPDVRIKEANLEAARHAATYRDNQTGLDLSLQASLSLGQSDAAYGYKSLGDALGHLTRPDTTNAYVGLRLVIPIDDNKTKAALARARVEESQARDRVVQARRIVVTQTENAVHDLNSAAAQIERGRARLEAARVALDAADAQLQLGKISQYELLNKLSDLLSARLDLRAAQVAERKAVVAAARARGTLEDIRAGGAPTKGGRS